MKRLLALLLVALTSSAYLTDSNTYMPLMTGTTGPDHYNNFTPASGSFPAVGSTYTDPIFGSAVRRLSNIGAVSNIEEIYSHHYANANGTYTFSIQSRPTQTLFLVNTSTGAELTGHPIGSFAYDLAWHPTDPDKYYFHSGASLMQRVVSTNTSSTVKTFAASLQSLGGTVNWIDRTGRYMLVKYSGTVKLWDSQTDTLYSNPVTPFGGSGWTGLSPDGNYIVDVSGPTAAPNVEHYSYAINHGATSVSTSPVNFWGINQDHGVMLTASNGTNYFVAFDDYNTTGIWMTDLTVSQAGKTYAQQVATYTQLVPMSGATAGHLSAVSVGTYQDWVFFSPSEIVEDRFNDVPSSWIAYEQEILAVNVLTLEKRRLAHHRSRGITGALYYNNPRVSCSWDGSVVLWTSNFNDSTPDNYADLYAINNPLGAAASADSNGSMVRGGKGMNGRMR